MACGLSSLEWPRPDPELDPDSRGDARRSAGRPLPPSATGMSETAPSAAAPASARRDLRDRREHRGLVLVAGLQPVELLDGVDDLGDVQERVALETDVNKGGLHAGEHLRDPALVDIADDAPLPLAFDEDLDDLILFEDRDTRVVIARGDDHLLVHWNSRSGGIRRALRGRVPAGQGTPAPGQPAREEREQHRHP